MHFPGTPRIHVTTCYLSRNTYSLYRVGPGHAALEGAHASQAPPAAGERTELVARPARVAPRAERQAVMAAAVRTTRPARRRRGPPALYCPSVTRSPRDVA